MLNFLLSRLMIGLVVLLQVRELLGLSLIIAAFYSIRETGLENKILIEAIQLRFGKINTIKPDSNNSYKITFSSKIDIQKVIDFFSSPHVHPLKGNKGEQYSLWLNNLKNYKRYSNLNFPTLSSNTKNSLDSFLFIFCNPGAYGILNSVKGKIILLIFGLN